MNLFLRRGLGQLVLLALVVVTVGCESPPQLKLLPPEAVIVAFGDSLTRGTGAGKGESYPEVLGQLLRRKVINAGIPGEVSAKGLDRLPGVLERYQPNLVILCHGGNDFLRRLDRDRTIANIQAMVSMIRERGSDVILVGVPQPGFFLEPPEFYRDIALSHQVPYEGEIVSALLNDDQLKSDTIHPNAQGYRLMAKAIHNLIQDSKGI
ncbi:MAG: arylesterase [Deltaproteobacteria bacterium]|jgi:lysophospholipase L1-like esterase|nr:arylesterase [Deltaproteobacteria bacterium]